MIAILGALMLGVIGMLLVGANASVNTASWGALANADALLYVGILCIVGALFLALGKAFKVI